ncbi:peptidase PmbA [Candidatus Termititenax aidoneus]|uniref:Peptidase PmbA n=1 Tax=Termititenax aidoneus TaxID=2218524 RepID=A0A388TCU9_TERA1|nr:peptidase PmbA [Candidatus Termititenax aidoneus]
MEKLALKKYLHYACRQGADEAEIFYTCGREESVVVRQGTLEKVESAGDRGLAVRVICQKRAGFAYTSALTDADILRTVDMALTNADYAERDKFLGLPPRKISKPQNLRNCSPAALKLTLPDLADWAKRAENAAYALDSRIYATESAAAFAASSETHLASTRGVDAHGKKTLCGVALEIAAKSGAKMEAAYDFQYAVSAAKIAPEKIGRRAAERAVRMLAAVPAQTGRYDLLLTPSVARDFLSVLAELFSAENILRQRSLFRGKLGRQVASAKVTLIDDPFLPALSGSFLYDGEGVPGRKRVLIKNGRLRDLFYDVYSARKCGVPHAGNAARASIFSEPSIGASNLYFQRGKLARPEIIKNISRGVLIENIMGLHTADPVSGEFSFGAAGQLIRDGRLAEPVKDMAIAGNLVDLLKSIKACGSDLEFSGHYGSPSILIENIMVAGK